jgi:hypothetical protein
MLKPLFAFLIAAAPAASLAQSPASAPAVAPGAWTVAGGAAGCIAHSSTPQGTVVSILASPGQETLLFVIQNPAWSTLTDGESIPLAVQLEGGTEYKFEAVAKAELDSDGPGYLFAVPPSAPFLSAFAQASGAEFGRGGRSLASVTLDGSSGVMANLAQCMAHMVSGTAPAEQGTPTFIRGTGKAVKL